MKYPYTKLLLAGALASILAMTAQAQVEWEGDEAGAASNKWDVAGNWDSNAVPTNATDVNFGTNTGLAFTNRGVLVGDGVTNSFANTVTVDIADWAVRPVDNNDILSVETSMTFTSNFTGSNPITTFTNAGGSANLRLAVGSNFTMTNNGTGTVSFDATNGGNDFGIVSTGSSSNFTFAGSGDFSFDGGIVFAGIDRFEMGSSATGTLSIEGGTIQSADRFGVLGGTVDINAGTINSDLAFANAATAEVEGYSGTIGGNLVVFNTGGSFLFDGSTDLTFTDLAGNGVMDITGWAEGSSSIVFSGLTQVVADGDSAGADFTLGGNDSFFWDDLGSGNWGLTTVPEPGTYALLAGMLALSWVMLRRRK